MTGDGVMTRMAGTAAILVAVFVCAAPAVLAQARPAVRPVFGGAAPPDPDARTSLDASLALVEAYDQDLLADAGAAPQPGVQAGGTYGSLTPVVSFSARGRHIGFSLGGSSNLRRYQVGRLALMNYGFAGGFNADVGRTTTIVANQAVSYSPSYLYALFGDGSTTPIPGAPIAGAADYKAASFQSYTYATSASLTHSFSPRASLTVDGGSRRTDFVGNVAGVGNMQWGGGGVQYRYSVSRDIVVSVGYSRWTSSNSLLRTTENDPASGVGFTKVLSATRRTTFGLNLGPTLARAELPIGGQWATQRAHVRLVGDAFFQREIGRTWTARAAYRRALTYVEGLAGPVYADNAGVTMSGFVNRRTDMLFTAAYVTGEMASQAASPARFTTYTGDVRLRLGLSRNVAAVVEGLFYDYRFDPRLIILPGVPSQFTRAGVRAGFTLWADRTTEHHAAR